MEFRALAKLYEQVSKDQPEDASINEEVEIFSRNEGESSPAYIGSINDKYYEVIRRQVIGQSKGGVNEVTDSILKACSWDAGNEREYAKNVLNPVLDVINNSSDVTTDEYSKFETNKDSLMWFANALNGREAFDFKSMCVSAMTSSFSDPGLVFDGIYKQSFTVNTVGVGKGELVMTMFSNAVKGKRGDLDVPGIGEVEVKGTDGRPGTGKNAINAVSTLPDYIKKITGKNIHAGDSIRSARTRVFSTGNVLRKLIKTKRDKMEGRDSTLLDNLFRYVEDVESSISSDSKPAEIVRVSANITSLINKLSIDSLPPRSNINSIVRVIKEYTSAVEGYADAIDKSLHDDNKKYSWGVTVQNALNVSWGMSIDQYIDGILHLVNEDLNPNMLKGYKEALSNIITPEVYTSLVTGDRTGILKTIIATIHSVSYQSVHEFPVLLFVNEKNYHVCPIYFDRDNVAERFIYVYEQYKNNTFNISLSLDKFYSNAVPVTFRG